MKRRRIIRYRWLLILAPLFARVANGEAQQASDRVNLLTSETRDFGSPVLSPDGRWLAFTVSESTTSSTIWIKPTTGGDPVRVTESGFWDDRIRWFPAGDRLLFLSNRPARAGDRHTYAMSLPIDPRTGRAAGPPRQVTADPVANATPRISQDGDSILYLDGLDRRIIKMAPAVGGSARVVLRHHTPVRQVTFSADGNHVLFTTTLEWPGNHVVLRVPSSGGRPVDLGRVESPIWASADDGTLFVRWFDGPSLRERTLEVITPDARPVHRFVVGRQSMPLSFTPDSRGVLVKESNAVGPTRLMPVAGGATRDLTAGDTYDWVLGFAPDGSAVYTWTEEKGQAVLARVPIAGGARQVWAESDSLGTAAVNSRYLFYQTKRAGDGRSLVTADEGLRRMIAVDLKNGQRHLVSDALVATGATLAAGPGGDWKVGEELYLFEQRGERLDVRAWSAPGRSRLVRSFPNGLRNRPVAVHGDRIVWQQMRGDSADIMTADGPSAAPRRLLSFPATAGTNELAISRDGSTVVFHYSRQGPGSPDLMAFADLDGERPPRIVETGWMYWYWPRWLPDGSGVLAVAGGAGADAHIGLVPARDGADPTILTRADPTSKWGFEVSPDGRYIAYPAETWKGSTIWRLNLPAPPASGRR